MRRTMMAVFAAALLLPVAFPIVHASDPTGAYVIADRVLLEPNESAPERVQIWGTFVLPLRDHRNDYHPPRRGYLYFRLPDVGADLARREWADLKRTAGQRQVVGLGSRYSLRARGRAEHEAPSDPDAYTVAAGLYRIRTETDYPLIKSLLDFNRR